MKYAIIQIFNLYVILVFIYVLLSWFPIPRDGILADINSFLAKICDPFLDIFRKFIPPIGGAVDISPIIAIFVLQFVVNLIVRML